VAQIAARECGKPTDLPAKQLEKVFKGLQDQRDEAKAQRDLAFVVQKEADVQKAIAYREIEEAITGGVASQNQLAKTYLDSGQIYSETAKQRSPGLTGVGRCLTDGSIPPEPVE
jgi:hypothetical protein